MSKYFLVQISCSLNHATWIPSQNQEEKKPYRNTKILAPTRSRFARFWRVVALGNCASDLARFFANAPTAFLFRRRLVFLGSPCRAACHLQARHRIVVGRGEQNEENREGSSRRARAPIRRVINNETHARASFFLCVRWAVGTLRIFFFICSFFWFRFWLCLCSQMSLIFILFRRLICTLWQFYDLFG